MLVSQFWRKAASYLKMAPYYDPQCHNNRAEVDSRSTASAARLRCAFALRCAACRSMPQITTNRESWRGVSRKGKNTPPPHPMYPARVSKLVSKRFKAVSKRFKGVSQKMNFIGCFKGVSKSFQRLFQRRFKAFQSVSKAFQRCTPKNVFHTAVSMPLVWPFVAQGFCTLSAAPGAERAQQRSMARSLGYPSAKTRRMGPRRPDGRTKLFHTLKRFETPRKIDAQLFRGIPAPPRRMAQIVKSRQKSVLSPEIGKSQQNSENILRNR